MISILLKALLRAIDFTICSTLEVWQYENEFMDTFIGRLDVLTVKITEQGSEVCYTWNVWQYYKKCK